MTLDFFCSSLRRSLEVVHALPREMRIIRGVKKNTTLLSGTILGILGWTRTTYRRS